MMVFRFSKFCFVSACLSQDLGEVKSATVLSRNQYVFITNSLDGSIKVVRGIDGPTQDGLQYIPCASEAPEGDPCAYEEIGDVQNARVVTQESALLVRSTDTGLQRIVDSPGPYYPGPYEVIEPSARSLIRVAEYETVVVAKDDGSFEFHSGAPNGTFTIAPIDSNSATTSQTTSGSSFFLPPYAQLLNFEWTVGYDVEEQVNRWC
eukprot:SAG31_NODE_8078_length_1527_cov_1.452381_2_plen_206_part_00